MNKQKRFEARLRERRAKKTGEHQIWGESRSGRFDAVNRALADLDAYHAVIDLILEAEARARRQAA